MRHIIRIECTDEADAINLQEQLLKFFAASKHHKTKAVLHTRVEG